ncbi:putative RNA-directed DNA polymerase, eukaryota, reverse transcriptase zinc-binding domain protein [Tanacetum coccineum]
MEGLHVAISDSVRNGLIRGIQVGSSDVNLSHLFFADDVIIMSEWINHDVENIIRIFKVFFLASGLKINIHKSNIYGVGVSPEDVNLMASATGCSAGSFPFTYLGLPIGSNMSPTANWKLLIDKFHSKLSSWKANLLSYGGRLTLLKSVLDSLDAEKVDVASMHLEGDVLDLFFMAFNGSDDHPVGGISSCVPENFWSRRVPESG